ncbi:MAG: hypothetical protein V1673_01625, partial [Candidatus Omnitrophota bacterium]
SEQILLCGRHPILHGRGAEDRESEIEYDERSKDMYQQIDNVKAPCRKTSQINVKDETEIGDKAERIVTPEFSEIRGLEGTVFQDVEGIIKLKRSGKGVGIGRDPEKQDQEKTGSCG